MEGIAIIHTRKVSGQLFVSSQSILMESDQFIQRYSGEEWYQTCIDSYGIDVEVPLDPNFSDGIITRVTANDAALQNAAVLSGSQTIRVYGNKLYGNGYSFVHNGVEYVPLSSTDEYDEFILTDNGSYYIYVGGQVFMSFSVTGVSFPTEFNSEVGAWLVDTNGNRDNASFVKAFDICLNYAKVTSQSYPRMYVRAYVDDIAEVAESDFVVTGASLVNYEENAVESCVELLIQPTSAETVSYVSFKGYIFFVGNYTA